MNVTITSGHGGIVPENPSILGPVDTATIDAELRQQIETLVHQANFFDLPALVPAPWTPASVTVVEEDRSHTVAEHDLPGASFEELKALLERAGATWHPGSPDPKEEPDPFTRVSEILRITIRRRSGKGSTEELGPVSWQGPDGTLGQGEGLPARILRLLDEMNFFELSKTMGTSAVGDLYDYTVEALRSRVSPNARFAPIVNTVFVGVRETTQAPPQLVRLIDLVEEESGETYHPAPSPA